MHLTKSVFFVTLIHVIASDECGTFTHMVKHIGKRLENEAIEFIPDTYSLTKCWGLCTRRYDCKSLNYAEDLSLCEMNSEFVSSEASLSNNTQYVYITTVDTESCEISPGANKTECCSDDTGSYNLQERSCPGASPQWCTCLNGFTGPRCSLSDSFSGIAASCQQYREAGHDMSGVLQIDPTGFAPSDVICDMSTDDGGWTVIQRRFDGSLLFNKTWEEYVIGFGSVDEEYWLGLENIYRLTGGSTDGQLRVELTDGSENQFYALYSFGILENSRYQVRFTYIEGDASDSLAYHDNELFSTRDMDDVDTCVDSTDEMDEDSYTSDNSSYYEVVDDVSCSEYAGGSGWWFKSGMWNCADCFASNLNAPYDSVVWGQLQNINRVELKYRK